MKRTFLSLILFFVLSSGAFLPTCGLAKNKAPLSFSDQDLAMYLKKNPNGVIYMVSPHMYLSVKGLPEYKKIAEISKISFLPLMDPVTNTRQNSFGGDLAKVRVLASKELLQKDAIVHYPAYIFHKGGVLQNRFNPGYDAPEKFEQNLKDFFR